MGNTTKRNVVAFILFFVIIISSTAYAQQPPHIAGVPGLSWGMPPEQVQSIVPGQLTGKMLVYQTKYYGYPAVGQYYFTENKLRYTTFVPRYTYDNTPQWKPEYQHLSQELKKVYGDPAITQEHRYIWKTPDTQAILLLQPNGWMTRYDRIPPKKEGGK